MAYLHLKFDSNDSIYATGDLHGNFEAITYNIKQHDLQNCAIIVCGDIGIGFEKEQYYTNEFNKIEKVCSKRNVNVVLGRGNHDKKSMFDGTHFTTFEHIHVIPDWTIITVNSINILWVGGAISVDRYMRINTNMLNEMKYRRYHANETAEEVEENYYKIYWEDEEPIIDITKYMEICNDGIKIDCICSHTCPSCAYPSSKLGISKWLELDQTLNDDINRERNIMYEILLMLKEENHPVTSWMYGHFHSNNIEIVDGVKFCLIDMCRDSKMEFKEILK